MNTYILSGVSLFLFLANISDYKTSCFVESYPSMNRHTIFSLGVGSFLNILDTLTSYNTNMGIKAISNCFPISYMEEEKATNFYPDTLATKESSTSFTTARTIVNLDYAEYEIAMLKKQSKEQRNVFCCIILKFCIVLVLLGVLVSILLLEIHKLQVVNHRLRNRMKQKDTRERKNKKNSTDRQMKEVSPIIAEKENEKLKEIHLKLIELMKNPAIFTNPKINRKSIAEKLGTNEKYVFDMIKHYYGTNISDYIANTRLTYAKNLLANPNEQASIETIAMYAGFNSRITFHRIFKERYGMTPTEFRQSITKL